MTGETSAKDLKQAGPRKGNLRLVFLGVSRPGHHVLTFPTSKTGGLKAVTSEHSIAVVPLPPLAGTQIGAWGSAWILTEGRQHHRLVK